MTNDEYPVADEQRDSPPKRVRVWAGIPMSRSEMVASLGIVLPALVAIGVVVWMVGVGVVRGLVR
jgi:hypothetical protein